MGGTGRGSFRGADSLPATAPRDEIQRIDPLPAPAVRRVFSSLHAPSNTPLPGVQPIATHPAPLYITRVHNLRGLAVRSQAGKRSSLTEVGNARRRIRRRRPE